MKPLVSIAIATYNGAKYLEEQLESILHQTYDSIEIIICDDQSSDNTISIIKRYQNNDIRIKLFINDKNLGYVKNFEKAISLCTGTYIALSDQDDIWSLNKIEVLLKNIGCNFLIHSDVSLIDEKGEVIAKTWKNEIKTHKVFEDFLFSNVVTGCTSMFKNELLKDLLPFPEALAYHDWYLAIHAARHKKIVYLNKSLVQYRQHTTQDTGATQPNYFSLLIVDLFRRLLGDEILRMVGIKKQLKNLEAMQAFDKLDSSQKKSVNDAILYFRSYVSSFVHIKMFLIGCKYKKHLYPKFNPFCIKNILRDVIG